MLHASQILSGRRLYRSISRGSMGWQELKETLAGAIGHHCSSFKHLHQLHSQVVVSGLGCNLYILSLLITKYFSFGDAETARLVFDGQRQRRPSKTLMWNSIIRGYLRIGLPRLALDVYKEMELLPECEPDKQTVHLAVTACSEISEFDVGLGVGRVARSKGFDSDLLVATALVGMYSRAGDVESARRLFDGMSVRDVVLWNAMISGYSQGRYCREAVELFRNMKFVHGVVPTETTLASVISCCGSPGSLEIGESMFAHATKTGFQHHLFVSNSLIEMYIQHGCLDMATHLFRRMVLKDAVSWSTMIGGYVRHGQPSDALQLFHYMISNAGIVPTRPILLNVLLACADLGNIIESKRIEETYLPHDFDLDPSLKTALIYTYVKCGELEMSLKLLYENPLVIRDVIAWNAILKACLELGQLEKVMDLASEMQKRCIDHDEVTFITLLSAVSTIPLLRKGAETHSQIIKRAFESDRTVSISLMDMYAKCGSIGDSRKVFNRIQEKDIISWSSMIKAYSWNGNAKEALELFHAMIRTGIIPNHFTFLAILSACSHAGLAEEGRELFKCMKEKYNLEPGIEHFACIVNILCQAGHVTDAYNLLQNVRLSRNAALWGTLLNACRLHGDSPIGEAAAKLLFHLEPGNAANYTMLADIYISAGRRQDSNNVLRLLRERGLERRPGYSWLEES